MKKFILFSIAASFLLACSGGDTKKESNSITLPTELQLGDFADYATFPNELTIKLAEEQSESSAEKKSETNSEKIKVFVTLSVDVTKSVASNYNFGCELSVVDADYTEIAYFNNVYLDSKTEIGEEYGHKLAKGPQHQKTEKEFTSEEWDKIKTKGAYIIIKVGGLFKKYKPYGDNNSYEPTISSSDNSSDGNLDDLLDSFESYVDKYISLMRKARNGDASALSEYPDMLEEAQSLSEKIQNASGQLNASQLEKYQRINNKMLKAAQELQ